MRTYVRTRVKRRYFFFTVNLAERSGNDLLVRRIEFLRQAFQETRRDHPFAVDGIVILPDHLHSLWRLPPGDGDFSTRWRLIKPRFSRRIETGERISHSRKRKQGRGIWQRRYWGHAIRDERDYRRHLDYICYNPVKHGYTDAPKDWPFSSFRRNVARGLYLLDWAASLETRQLNFE